MLFLSVFSPQRPVRGVCGLHATLQTTSRQDQPQRQDKLTESSVWSTDKNVSVFKLDHCAHTAESETEGFKQSALLLSLLELSLLQE